MYFALSSYTKKKTREGQNKSIPEIRYDGKNHWPKKYEMKSALRCHDNMCRSRTRYKCSKCDEPVCPECMEHFHSQKYNKGNKYIVKFLLYL
jgi:hypothetical protein